MHALRILLADVVDYAGLFPPASLSLADAAGRYASYRASDAAWMLGRFVLPAARMPEVAALPNAPPPTRLALLLGARWADELRAAPPEADCFELRVDDVGNIAAVRHALDACGRGDATAYAEVPWSADMRAMAAAARDAAVALKLRTGGVTADAFPPPDVVLAFLDACVAHGVACKLTAGLHHPLRAEHALTYETGCVRGTMYGFLNALVAAALLAAGHSPARVAPVLEERSAGAFRFDDGVEIRGMRAASEALHPAVRALRSFGSCSFDEPVRDLRALALLPSAGSSPATL